MYLFVLFYFITLLVLLIDILQIVPSKLHNTIFSLIFNAAVEQLQILVIACYILHIFH